MKRTAVINVVGLSEALLGEHTPRLAEFARHGARARVTPVLPAVTCSAQSTYLTGQPPSQHGIVGNGWYNRELAEVQFWRQSNHLVQGNKIWDHLRARAPQFTCAKLFWWFNMYSGADWSITPRPMYPADGRKVFDIYTWPYSIRAEIKRDLGEFPFPTFWGPAAGVHTPQGPPAAASCWIAEAAKWIESRFHPTLNLIYLPHLDYNLQRFGVRTRSPKSGIQNAALQSSTEELNPAILPDLRAMDAIVGDLIDFFGGQSVQVVLLSEYGITNVDRPLHLNRLFRQQGWLTVKEELGLELLDCGASRVFAVADHQVAHVHLNDPGLEHSVRTLLENTPGVEAVLDAKQKVLNGLDHPRAGDLIAVADEGSWFTYYYWLDDRHAPDFARTVDIHRKPGYDPVELFCDPELKWPKLKIAWRLLQKKLGFRMLMDVIPLDASLVRGSHGRRPAHFADQPVFLTTRADLLQTPRMESTDVLPALVRHVLD